MWKNNPSLNLPPIRDSQSAPNLLQHNKSRWFSTTYNTVFNARPLGKYSFRKVPEENVCTKLVGIFSGYDDSVFLHPLHTFEPKKLVFCCFVYYKSLKREEIAIDPLMGRLAVAL